LIDKLKGPGYFLGAALIGFLSKVGYEYYKQRFGKKKTPEEEKAILRQMVSEITKQLAENVETSRRYHEQRKIDLQEIFDQLNTIDDLQVTLRDYRNRLAAQREMLNQQEELIIQQEENFKSFQKSVIKFFEKKKIDYSEIEELF